MQPPPAPASRRRGAVDERVKSLVAALSPRILSPMSPTKPSARADPRLSWQPDGRGRRAARRRRLRPCGRSLGGSTGEHEALELRDGEPGRFDGKGVLRAVANVHDATPALIGMEANDQGIDRALLASTGPTTSPRSARTRSSVSLATARAAADAQALPLWRSLGGPNAHVLPTPMLNAINGGAHADNELELQEFMLMPVGAALFSEGLRWGVECFPR